MASVCAGTLALMDGGVPIKSPVAGIAMGLITGDDGKYAVLTDIQGAEDHSGDMDFKVAGTKDGITALQMDIKVKGINFEIMKEALEQAREARLEILDHITELISEPKPELNENAPRMLNIKVPVDKIGAVIGSGGSVIRGMIEEFGVTIDIDDEGNVVIGSNDAESAERAKDAINTLTKDVEPGVEYHGKVVCIMQFGAFVQILPGKDGLVHISELDTEHIADVESAVKIGDEIDVMVIGVDNMGKIDLSRRAILIEESLDVVKERRSSGRKNDRNNRGGRDRGGRGGRGGRDNFDRNSRGGGRNRRSVGGYNGDSRPSPPSRY